MLQTRSISLTSLLQTSMEPLQRWTDIFHCIDCRLFKQGVIICFFPKGRQTKELQIALKEKKLQKLLSSLWEVTLRAPLQPKIIPHCSASLMNDGLFTWDGIWRRPQTRAVSPSIIQWQELKVKRQMQSVSQSVEHYVKKKRSMLDGQWFKKHDSAYQCLCTAQYLWPVFSLSFYNVLLTEQTH